MSELMKYGRDKFGNHTDDEAMVRFWDNSGLLEGLKDDLRLDLSKHLDKTAIYMVKNNIKGPENMEEGLEIICFPAIRRIYSEAIKNDKIEILDGLDVEDIVDKLILTYENTFNAMVSIYGDSKKVDHVAEAVSIVSEHIYNSYTYNYK